jgi:malonyl-CoA O-methyltransferase
MGVSPVLDKQRIRRRFARAAPSYDAAAVVGREVGSRLLERLDLVRLTPTRVLDLGSGTGLAARALAQRYRDSRVLALDFCLAMLQQRRRGRRPTERLRSMLLRAPIADVCADLERLPLAPASIDLVVSNLVLHWSAAMEPSLAEVHRVLRRGGLFLFSTLGPDTLKELAAASADGHGRTPVHAFADMHDLGDLLVSSGFADPVMEMERLTATYARVDDLLRDLRATGSLSAKAGAAGLRTPRWRERLRQRYETFRREGRLPATLEVVYGHAWKPEQGPRVTADGRAVVRFDPSARR